MASTTFSAPNAPRAKRRLGLRDQRGFTLAEVIIATVLSAIAVAGTLSTTLMIVRSGYNISHYADMENESRRSLEQFGQDVRMAKSITWNDANSITLVVPTTATATASYTYTYSPTAQTFSRTANGTTTVLVSGIESCTLMGYQLNGDQTHSTSSTPASWTIVANSTKQLQLSISSKRSQGSQINTTQKVISARFILRNKNVSA